MPRELTGTRGARCGCGEAVRRSGALALVTALALTGCSRSDGPAPVAYGEHRDSRVTETRTASRSRERQLPEVYEVRRGDTVYEIAQRFGVSMRAIIDVNGLGPPYELAVGQKLRIPPPQQYEVERGDTLYSISRRFGVDMNVLARANDIGPPYTIHPGQTLVIPDRGETGTATASLDGSDAGGARASQQQTQTEQTASSSSSASSSGSGDAGAGAPETTTDSGDSADGGEVGSQSKTTARSGNAPSPPPRDAESFLWPVRGKVIAAFGPQESGLHNDGINIAAPDGTPIKAAANGVVVYVGSKLKGFGNLVLVKHEGGWITAYAHAGTIIVDHGERVRRGETIARVGQSGNVNRPQLHFEVRKGSKAVDPTRVLANKRTARTAATGTG